MQCAVAGVWGVVGVCAKLVVVRGEGACVVQFWRGSSRDAAEFDFSAVIRSQKATRFIQAVLK